MANVEARELEKRLGHFLRQVQGGKTIVVTLEGHPIAELRPFATAVPEVDARLRELETSGLVRLPTRPKSQQIPRVTLPDPPVSETIREDREDRCWLPRRLMLSGTEMWRGFAEFLVG